MSLRLHPLPPGLAPRAAYRRLRGAPGVGRVRLLESLSPACPPRPDGTAPTGAPRSDRITHPAAERFAFVAAAPFLELRAMRGGVDETDPGGGTTRRPGSPLELLSGHLERIRLDPAEARRAGAEVGLDGSLPFPGGACGWLGYELGTTLEAVPAAAGDDLGLPLFDLGLHDLVLGWDLRSGTSWLVEVTGGTDPAGRRARLDAVRAALEGADEADDDPSRPADPDDADTAPSAARPPVPEHPVPGLPGVTSTFTREAYEAAVGRVREYIRAGDLFQANLTQRFQAPWAGDPFALYERLAARHPAPFAAYLEGPDGAVVSASPERFLSVRDGRVETRPIKGTAHRSADPEADRAAARALLESGKDRAENVMIVDLLRNDLARVCEDDSVEVPALCALESHPTVHHLVSTVTGRLRPGVGPGDVLRATFPGGSITGAPKIRAMEVIAELEPTARGVYTGSVGWIGWSGDMDLSIAIRTVLVRGGRATVPAGGGVVLDSEPAAEWRESVQKVRGILEALTAGEAEPRADEGATGPAPPGGRIGGERGAGGADGAIGAVASVRPGEAPDPAGGRPPDPGARVVLLDHHDSFVHTLARYLRLLGARTTVVRPDVEVAALEALRPTHLVLSPGPCTPRECGVSPDAVRAFAGRIPVLGVCLGHLCIADALGGGWRGARAPAHGRASEVHHRGEGILRGVPSPFRAGRYHSLAVGRDDVPPGLRVVAWTDDDEVMAVADPERGLWGLQLHPESILTPWGFRILEAFLRTAVGQGGGAPAEAGAGSATGDAGGGR